MNKLTIAAGTGFLGQVLIRHFKKRARDIVVLTRGSAKVEDGVRYVHWDAKTLSGWERELEGADLLINLAGRSVDCRYHEKNRRDILESRVESTRVLHEAVATLSTAPKHWINSSTATIYRHSEDRLMDETTGEIGDDFSMNVAKAWEAAFFQQSLPTTLQTAIRTSIVLGKQGGAFVPLRVLTKLGLGGTQGPGHQKVSWIHETDFARAVEFAYDHALAGAVNVVAPKPVENVSFMRALRQAFGIPLGLPSPTPLLKLGAFFIRTEPELLLKSRNVIPQRLLEAGFEFQYGELNSALKELASD